MVRQLLPLRATQTSVSRRNLSILSTVSTHIHRVLCNRSAMEVPQGCVRGARNTTRHANRETLDPHRTFANAYTNQVFGK